MRPLGRWCYHLGACLPEIAEPVVTIAANQQPFAEALAQAAHLYLLGDASEVGVEQIVGSVGSCERT